MPLQAGINGQLARQLSSVMGAALLSFAVGTLALLCVVAAQRDLPALQTLKGLSWWHWSGGLLGAFFIATAAFAAPRTGALLFMALVLAGQLCMALLLDHFGWAGFRPAPLSPRQGRRPAADRRRRLADPPQLTPISRGRRRRTDSAR